MPAEGIRIRIGAAQRDEEIRKRKAGGLWCDGVGCGVCCYDCDSVGVVDVSTRIHFMTF